MYTDSTHNVLATHKICVDNTDKACRQHITCVGNARNMCFGNTMFVICMLATSVGNRQRVLLAAHIICMLAVRIVCGLATHIILVFIRL